MTGNNQPKIGGLLLAAGGSSRLGRPKQLLQFRGMTLLRHAAQTLVDSVCDPIVVILGAETERSQTELDDVPVTICINPEWQTGMSSSIRTGLAKLQDISPNIDAVVITLCDQLHVTSGDIDDLVSAFRDSDAPIAAAKYGDSVGVPALFSREIFDDLSHLEGDKGARQIVRSRVAQVRTVKMETAAIDIDTPDDFDRLIIDRA